LKKKYLRYDDYKEQTMADIFTPEQLSKAVRLDAYELRSCVFLNDGKGGFVKKPLPMEAQFSSLYGLLPGDFDGDGKMDLVVGGNFYESKPEVGIYDACYGLLLKGDGRGGFVSVPEQKSGILMKGAVRDLRLLKMKKEDVLVASMNNDTIRLFSHFKNH